MALLILKCPQCPDIKQGTSVSSDRLKEMLASGESISVIGSVCGHVWNLSADEVKNIRAASTAGTL